MYAAVCGRPVLASIPLRVVKCVSCFIRDFNLFVVLTQVAGNDQLSDILIKICLLFAQFGRNDQFCQIWILIYWFCLHRLEETTNWARYGF